MIAKYKATSYSALYDKCTAAEWENVLNKYQQSYVLNNEITASISLYVKQRLVVEREDRFGYLLDCAENGDSNSRNAISELFIRNHIVPSDFVHNLEKILNCQETKINCLFLVGPSNSGKSFVAQSISSHFITGYASCANSLSEFSYENFLNKSLIVLEEPFITDVTCDDMKNILAGANIQVGKKYMSKQDLCRTPVIMTGNHHKLGKGYLSPKDEEALKNRLCVYEFTEPFVASSYIKPEHFADWVLFIYRNLEC